MKENIRKNRIMILGSCILLYTGLIMLNWITGKHILDFADDRWIGMVFNTALLFSILTVSILLKSRGGIRKGRIAGLMVVGVALFSVVAMLQYTTGRDFGIDQLFVKTAEEHVASIRPGSMAPLTAVNFILIAIVVFMHDLMVEARYQRIAQFILGIVFSVSIFIICGRLLGSPELGNIPGKTSMAATTAAMFLLQVLLCYLLYPTLILNKIRDSYNYKMLIGRGIPILLIAPISIQAVIFGFENTGQISDAMGHSLYVAMFIVLSMVGLLYLAGIIYRGELKVREVNDKYNRFFSLSNDFLLIVKPDGQAVAMNDTWSQELGWSSDELYGHTMEVFAHPSENINLARYAELIDHEGKRAVQRIGITTKSGELRMIEWDCSKDSTTQLIYCVGRDVTLQHELESKHVQARNLAEQASRAKSDFLANMSHELRTPLNSIIGFTEVLGDRLYGDLNERQQEYIVYIDQSARHLLNLINDVLDLSKIEAGKMVLDLQLCSIRQIVESALSMFREKCYRGGIALSASFASEDIFMIEIDERKVKQILYNLLSNGVKFTPAGGQVTVIVEELQDENEDMLAITVKDTGEGIPEEHQALLFTKFHQAETVYDKVHEGTGLGLALTKELVELHGGRITMKSHLGEGSSFTVYLPVMSKEERVDVHDSEDFDSRR